MWAVLGEIVHHKQLANAREVYRQATGNATSKRNSHWKHGMEITNPIRRGVQAVEPQPEGCIGWTILLEWIDDHLPKQLLFGWLPQCRPPNGGKLHWRDKVRRDLRAFYINEAGWYVLVQNRQDWHRIYKGGSSVSSTAWDGRFYCDGCQRSSGRSQDKARYSCEC